MGARRRPRLFSFGRKTELANLDAWIDDPDHRELLVRVIDAFVEVTRTRKLTPEQLDPISEAAGHGSQTVRAVAVSRLVVLSHYFPDALQRLGDLSKSADEGVRLFAAASLANAPEEALGDLLEPYLTDASRDVRKSAAHVWASNRPPSLAEVIAARRRDEDDASVLQILGEG